MNTQNLNEKARKLGYHSYRDYINDSVHWHMFKRLYLARYCWSCRDDVRWKLELHHISYDRIGSEDPGDVITLCKFCHELCHKLIGHGEATLEDAHTIVREIMQNKVKQLSFEYERHGSAA